MPLEPWEATKIRYIKLGERGEWWEDCRDKQRLRLGFKSGDTQIFDLATNKKWNEIKNYWIEQNTNKPTERTNQMRDFFEDDSKTLWITFEEGCLYYAYTDGGEITCEILSDQNPTTYRKLTPAGWSNLDSSRNELRIEGLHGALTATRGYPGTICGLRRDPEIYLRNRLQCKQSKAFENAKTALSTLQASIVPLVQSLTPQDFEILIELIF
jgi:hypothetical protein